MYTEYSVSYDEQAYYQRARAAASFPAQGFLCPPLSKPLQTLFGGCQGYNVRAYPHVSWKNASLFRNTQENNGGYDKQTPSIQAKTAQVLPLR